MLFRRNVLFVSVLLVSSLILLLILVLDPVATEPALAALLPEAYTDELPRYQPAAAVAVEQNRDGSFQYVVNGAPQVFIGVGYNPIYRDLPDARRLANYQRDFRMLCEAGANHIVGWDSDKGYEQDKWDELTLDAAAAYGIGVIMPFYLPADGNYDDPVFRQRLLDGAAAKIAQFKSHPALRMWGVGNEVLNDRRDMGRELSSFDRFYPQIADLFHDLDPAHPVIYREAEDIYVSGIVRHWLADRPWLLYGTNVYTNRIGQILDQWPSFGLSRPIVVTEFGAPPEWAGGRSQGYFEMWQQIRARASHVLGGAPYAWSVAGPEPVDVKWGLVDDYSLPIDGTFARLAGAWRSERQNPVCQQP